MSKNIFNKTLIIGLGLIGGSFAKALREHDISEEIFACDLNKESLLDAKSQKIIDGEFAIDSDLSGFDFIVIATPLSFYKEIFDKIKKTVSKRTIIIDLGSLKNFNIPKELSNNFVGCHPIAGSQENGFEVSDVNLFLEKKFVICPQEENSKIIANLATRIGARVEFMEAKKHDEIYALVSHLPQFISFLTKEISPKNIKDNFFKNAFRLNDSAPEIWEDIFKMNQANLEKFYINFFENLAEIMEQLDDGKKIQDLSINNSSNLDLIDFDEDYFIANFAEIFFRSIIVASYLQIPQIKTYQESAGKGFTDFTSIINILNYQPEKLQNLFEKNRAKIFKFFDLIS